MDIEKPSEREFFLLAPEIAEKQVQAKRKKKDPDDDIKLRGEIHSQKYLNNCNPVKLPGEPLTLSAHCPEYAVQQGDRVRRTARDIQVYRDNLPYTSEGGIALAKYTAVASTITNSHHKLWRRSCIIRSAKGDLHVPCDRPGDQKHIRKSRRGRKMDTEPLAVVDRVVQGMDLQFTAVTGTRIDLTYREASAEALSDRLL